MQTTQILSTEQIKALVAASGYRQGKITTACGFSPRTLASLEKLGLLKFYGGSNCSALTKKGWEIVKIGRMFARL